MDENLIGEKILGAALKVHRVLGPGLLESAYEACLVHEFVKLDLPFQRQVLLPIRYDGLELEVGYRLDVLVADRVVVEIRLSNGSTISIGPRSSATSSSATSAWAISSTSM